MLARTNAMPTTAVNPKGCDDQCEPSVLRSAGTGACSEGDSRSEEQRAHPLHCAAGHLRINVRSPQAAVKGSAFTQNPNGMLTA
jgi:hypothetical protein